jgi:hypothetical protein
MRPSIASFFALFAVIAAGCGKGAGAGGCPPMEVTIDGAAVSLTHVLAVADTNPGGISVEAFDGDEVTCEQLVAPRRQTRHDEISVRTYVAPGGGMQAVSIGAWTHMGATTRLVSEPKKEGDTAAICVPTRVEFTPEIGAHKGKKVTVLGLFSGTFCGTRG